MRGRELIELGVHRCFPGPDRRLLGLEVRRELIERHGGKRFGQGDLLEVAAAHDRPNLRGLSQRVEEDGRDAVGVDVCRQHLASAVGDGLELLPDEADDLPVAGANDDPGRAVPAHRRKAPDGAAKALDDLAISRQPRRVGAEPLPLAGQRRGARATGSSVAARACRAPSSSGHSSATSRPARAVDPAARSAHPRLAMGVPDGSVPPGDRGRSGLLQAEDAAAVRRLEGGEVDDVRSVDTPEDGGGGRPRGDDVDPAHRGEHARTSSIRSARTAATSRSTRGLGDGGNARRIDGGLDLGDPVGDRRLPPAATSAAARSRCRARSSAARRRPSRARPPRCPRRRGCSGADAIGFRLGGQPPLPRVELDSLERSDDRLIRILGGREVLPARTLRHGPSVAGTTCRTAEPGRPKPRAVRHAALRYGSRAGGRLAGPREHRVEHRPREAAGVRVLLAHVVAAEQRPPADVALPRRGRSAASGEVSGGRAPRTSRARRPRRTIRARRRRARRRARRAPGRGTARSCRAPAGVACCPAARTSRPP